MTYRLLILGAVLAVLFGTFAAERTYSRTWGATPTEATARLPGDEIVPHAVSQETRALTIHAPAERVWPWLAQLGQDRGGFYSYELLEDLAGCEMENLDHLDPALQEWKPGDKLWMYPPEKLGDATSAPLAVHVPGRVLGFATHQIGSPPSAPADGSWTFIVEPVDAETSRLIVRGRAASGLSAPAMAFTYAVFDPMHFTMERKMMEVLAARAEGRPVSEAADVVQVLLWTVCAGAFTFFVVRVLRGKAVLRSAASALGAGLLFQLLTFTQPSVWLGAAMVTLLLAASLLPARRTSRPAAHRRAAAATAS